MVGKVILPALLSPVIAGVVAAVGTWLIYRVVAGVARRFTDTGFRWGQIGSASLVSLAHGTHDAQKATGVITLALIASGHWSDSGNIPFWVKAACALTIAAGPYLGGWRIIRTVGKGLVEIAPPQGIAAESTSAVVVLASGQLGFALSTTHVATRLDPWHRGRQAGRGGPLAGRRPDGRGLADHDAQRGGRGRTAGRRPDRLTSRPRSGRDDRTAGGRCRPTRGQQASPASKPGQAGLCNVLSLRPQPRCPRILL